MKETSTTSGIPSLLKNSQAHVLTYVKILTWKCIKKTMYKASYQRNISTETNINRKGPTFNYKVKEIIIHTLCQENKKTKGGKIKGHAAKSVTKNIQDQPPNNGKAHGRSQTLRWTHWTAKTDTFLALAWCTAEEETGLCSMLEVWWHSCKNHWCIQN